MNPNSKNECGQERQSIIGNSPSKKRISTGNKLGKRCTEVIDENKDLNAAKPISNGEENAKSRTSGEIIEQYQPLLRNYEKDEKLVLHKAGEELATKPGQNFLSKVHRTTVFGTKGDKTPYKKSFIRKVELADEAQRKEYRSQNFFLLEIHMYKEWLPRFGSIGPKYVSSKEDEIILEDLGERKFYTFKTRDFFDLEHCLAVVQTLASMHAKSLIFKLREKKKFDSLIEPIKENVFTSDGQPSLSIHYEKSIAAALKNLRLSHPEEKGAIEFLQRYENKVIAKMMELLSKKTGDTDRYWVITHGDVWKNNIMFHHDDAKKIVNVKFVDFQVARHSSPALDFTYFLYTSAETEAMKHNIDRIIEEYENFFLHDLRQADLPESVLTSFTRGWFVNELRQYGLFGLFGGLTTINAIFMDEKTAAIHEKGRNSAGEMESSGMETSKEKTDRILFIIGHYMKHFDKNIDPRD